MCPVHPRTMPAEGLRPGMRVELAENSSVLARGVIRNITHRQCYGARRQIVSFQPDDSCDGEFIYFAEYGGWMMVFPGMADEPCVNISASRHVYVFLGILDALV